MILISCSEGYSAPWGLNGECTKRANKAGQSPQINDIEESAGWRKAGNLGQKARWPGTLESGMVLEKLGVQSYYGIRSLSLLDLKVWTTPYLSLFFLLLLLLLLLCFKFAHWIEWHKKKDGDDAQVFEKDTFKTWWEWLNPICRGILLRWLLNQT